MYPIAKWLPLAARQEAASRTYRPKNTVFALNPSPICADGRCPLGVILDVLGFGDSISSLRPPASYVTSVLVITGNESMVWHDHIIEKEASDFIRDWDRGLITDLAAALGVEPHEGNDHDGV